jgi:putative nucleotidyltransferase with HDIG domain
LSSSIRKDFQEGKTISLSIVPHSPSRNIRKSHERLSAHAYAVSDSATAIARAWGLSQQDTVRIGMAALLHDIGKIAVADRLVLKSTPLSPQESTLLQEHAVIGAQILEASPFFYDPIPAVRSHHERWDGHGYPDQLAGEDIPLAARIIAVSEAYDAMQRDYPSQSVRSPQHTLEELQNEAGCQFDPAVVNVFSTLLVEQQNIPASPPLVV